MRCAQQDSRCVDPRRTENSGKRRGMDCLFCSIISGDVESRQVASDDVSLAFLDVSPAQEGHTLVVPRHHVTSALDDEGELARIMPMVTKVAHILVDKLGASGVNLLVNSGTVAGQSVDHLHVHVIPRYESEPGMSYVRTQLPMRPVDEIHVQLCS